MKLIINITLLLFITLNSAFAAEISPKRFLFCENKHLQLERFKINVDKDIKNRVSKRIVNEKLDNIDYLEVIIERYCADFSGQY